MGAPPSSVYVPGTLAAPPERVMVAVPSLPLKQLVGVAVYVAVIAGFDPTYTDMLGVLQAAAVTVALII